MKVKITLTVDVDSEVWASEYGLDKSEVRADVKSKVQNDVYSQLVDVLGIANDVTS